MEAGGGCNGSVSSSIYMQQLSSRLCGRECIYLYMRGAEWDIAKEKRRDCFGDHTVDF